MSEAIGSIQTNGDTQSINSEVKQITPKCIIRLNAIHELSENDLSLREIARRTGIPYASVSRICKMHGVVVQKNPQRPPHHKRIPKEMVIAARAEGISKSEAAARWGIPKSSLTRLMRRYDLSGLWPGSYRTARKHKLTAEQLERGRVVAHKVRALSASERARYHELKDAGMPVLQRFAQIARDRRASERSPPKQA